MCIVDPQKQKDTDTEKNLLENAFPKVSDIFYKITKQKVLSEITIVVAIKHQLAFRVHMKYALNSKIANIQQTQQ